MHVGLIFWLRTVVLLSDFADSDFGFQQAFFCCGLSKALAHRSVTDGRGPRDVGYCGVVLVLTAAGGAVAPAVLVASSGGDTTLERVSVFEVFDEVVVGGCGVVVTAVRAVGWLDCCNRCWKPLVVR